MAAPVAGSTSKPIVEPVAIAPAMLLALHAAEPGRYPALFESAAPGEPLGRFDILFACPRERLTLGQDARLSVTGHGSGHPTDAISTDRASAGSVSTDNASIESAIENAGGRFLPALDAWWRAIRPSPAAACRGPAPAEAAHIDPPLRASAPGDGAALDPQPQPPEPSPESADAPHGHPDLPFTGGWLLYLGYELAGQIEPRLRMHHDADAPVAQAIRVPAAIIHAHASGKSWILAERNAQDCLAHIRQDIERLAATVPVLPAAPAELLDDAIGGAIEEDPPQHYLQIVRRALEYIAAGDVYQANLSRGWRARLRPGVQPHHLYQRLRRTNPGPFNGIARIENMSVVTSSPERLVAVRGGQISTRPIAGTRPRSQDRAADEALVRELREHPKERAEHIMLIDLERNDLGRICRAGSVRVDEYMSIESYAHVHHIVSNVCGQLRENVTPGEVLAAVFPGGTITGCPKVRCMEVIGELEQQARGAYTGSLGYLNLDGSMDLNILIRSLQVQADVVSLRTGAGIVADSIPEHELAETRAKARGVLRALDPLQERTSKDPGRDDSWNDPGREAASANVPVATGGGCAAKDDR